MSGSVLLAAGGTGGHLFPAQALGEKLRAAGWQVHLATDARGGRYKSEFPADGVHVVPSATIASRSPVALACAAVKLARGLVAALILMGRVKPGVVVGFGGYPSLPTLAAARLRGVPIVLHEQNAVMGRANRAFAGAAAAIATGFADTGLVGKSARAKLVHTGNPVRAAVLKAAQKPYRAPARGGAFNLLVFGGSQGARVFSDIVPQAVEMLDAASRERLCLVQQARQEDLDRVRAACGAAELRQCSVEAFFGDLPERMAAAHLIIARAGASTVSELAAIGRPSILVPLPHSIDNDQAMNAQALAKIGAARVLPQAEFTPQRLAEELETCLRGARNLAEQAAAAKSIARMDATARLAGLVEQAAAGLLAGGRGATARNGDAS